MAQTNTNNNGSVFELLLEKAADAVVIIDETKNVSFWNEKAEELWGYSKEEALGENINNFVPDEHKKPHDGYVDSNLKTGENRIVGTGREVELQKKDGTRIPVFLTMSKLEEGKKTYYMAVVKDITQEKETRLKAESIQSAVDSGWARIEFEPDGTILEANNNFLSALGYTSNEVVGSHHRMFCDREYASTADYKQFWNDLAEGDVKSGEFPRITKAGKEIWIQASYSPVKDDQGNVKKVIKIASDITEQKEQQLQIEENQKAYVEASRFINGMSRGDFSYQMETDKLEMDEGTAEVIEDLNNLRNDVQGILSELGEVVNKAGQDGDLKARLSVKAQGDWGELVNSVNMLLESISTPMSEFQSIVENMAQGDLTGRYTKEANGDIKSMADALNAGLDSLNDLLVGIGQNAQEVAASSEQVLAKTDGMQASTTEVASAIQEMASGAQDQAIKTDESSKLVEDVMESANLMELKSNTINEAAVSGSKSCDNGLNIMSKLVAFMNDIESASMDTSQSIEILTERSEEIGRTLKVITDIAAQTNLLALNAAIEAARAGEAGRGFAVVADEIRNLAEESKNAATEIEKIIDNVSKDTQKAGKSIETMKESVKQGNASTKEAESSFADINKSSEETLNLSREVITASDEQKRAIEKVVKNIEQIVVVSEETAAGTQEISSSTMELNGGMSEINQGANRLAEIADELRNGLAQFKLKQ